jgi:hypothetical protein
MAKLIQAREKYALARATGSTQAEAAAEAGVSARSAVVWDREPDVKARIAELQAEGTEDALRFLRSKSLPAAKRLWELTQAGSRWSAGSVAATNLAAVKDVLDRVGLKPAERHEHTGADGGPITVERVSFREGE